jgi:hypothetical protein
MSRNPPKPFSRPILVELNHERGERLVFVDNRLLRLGLAEQPLPGEVVIPDAAFAMRARAADIAILAGTSVEGLQTEITSALLAAFGSNVQVVFGETTYPATGRQSMVIGLFFERSDDPIVAGTRQSGIHALFDFAGDLFEDGEEAAGGMISFGVWWNLATIRRMVNDAWNAAPKRFSFSGEPDPCGRVYLDALEFDFPVKEGEANLEVKIRGHLDLPVLSHAGFTATIQETVTTGLDDTLNCSRTRSDLDIHFPWDVLRGVVNFVWEVVRRLLWFATGFLAPGISDPSTPHQDLLCQYVQRLPNRILVPSAGKKILLFWGKVHADFRFAGQLSLVQLQPEVQISGPRRIPYQGEDEVQATYSLWTNGELIPPLTMLWTADGVVSSPEKASTLITFTTAPTETANRRTVSVSATDRDGRVEEDSIEVELIRRFDLPLPE